MKIKKFIVFSLSILLLTGCGSDEETGSETEIAKAGKVVYETGDFSIQIPKDWETIEKDSYPSNVPSQTQIGFRNNIKNELFTANVNISKKELNQEKEISSEDFAKSSLAIIKKSLIGFNQINETKGSMEYGDDELETYILELEGKKSSSESFIRFRQVYIVNNGTGYSITAAYLPNEDESVVNALQEMLDSFALK